MGERAAEPETIEVFAPGSEVLVDGRVTGYVQSVRIYENRLVGYDVVWWDDHGRHDEVLHPREIRSDSEKARKMRVDTIL